MTGIELSDVARLLYEKNRTVVIFHVTRTQTFIEFWYKEDHVVLPFNKIYLADCTDITDVCIRIFTHCFTEIGRQKCMM